jgi:hypothetical protein
MEMCWLYSWAALSLSRIVDGHYPLHVALGAFIAGLLTSRAATGRGWRIIAVLGLHLAGFACIATAAVNAVYFPLQSFSDVEWLKAPISHFHGFVQWAGLGLVVLWTLFFWIGGVAMSRRPATYYKYCSRFDIGLAAFFCLFLFKLALRVKGGLIIDAVIPEVLIFPFLLAGIFAIVILRPDDGNRSASFRGTAVIMGFILILLILVVVATGPAIPALNSAARATHGMLKNAAGFSVPFIESTLFFLFSRGSIRPEPASSVSRGKAWSVSYGAGDSWWMELVDKILGYGLWGVLLLLSSAMMAVALALAARWLLSATRKERRPRHQVFHVPPWFFWLWRKLVGTGATIRQHTRGIRSAGDGYRILMKWARRSGCPSRPEETPSEFANRLGTRFPSLSIDIGIIVTIYSQAVYGEIKTSGEHLKRLSSACRILRSPLHWPLRLITRTVGHRPR